MCGGGIVVRYGYAYAYLSRRDNLHEANTRCSVFIEYILGEAVKFVWTILAKPYHKALHTH